MEAPVVTYIGMSIEELSPYLDRLQAGIAGMTQGIFFFFFLLAAIFLYDLFWRRRG